jgi:DNA invertase Pin-like site-specific DNA recombinase
VPGLKIGYARVSARDQNPNGRGDQLDVAGCEWVFIGHASGKLAS